MAEPPSPGRGAAPPEQELLGARTAPDAKGSRGSQPAAKKVKGAEERSLKGAKRVNGEGGGGGGSSKQSLPAVVPSYSGPGPWGFATLPSGPSAGAGGFAFPSPLSRKLLPPAVLLPPSASPSSSLQSDNLFAFGAVEKEQQCGIDGIDRSSLLAFRTDKRAGVAPARRKIVLVGRLEV
ncbi:PREDICTED: round spermatid basic protein 1-like protein [Ficedula albicollis]|uniref:round spermatid basic protein 1-like protein n=1 Tax=Ficedula albicollis TaxID=59894 RepID=UPI0007AD852F|nr:PREDICTED: round spermatid basic protein 1-like protein [Ficedula albicollis]